MLLVGVAFWSASVVGQGSDPRFKEELWTKIGRVEVYGQPFLKIWGDAQGREDPKHPKGWVFSEWKIEKGMLSVLVRCTAEVRYHAAAKTVCAYSYDKDGVRIQRAPVYSLYTLLPGEKTRLRWKMKDAESVVKIKFLREP